MNLLILLIQGDSVSEGAEWKRRVWKTYVRAKTAAVSLVGEVVKPSSALGQGFDPDLELLPHVNASREIARTLRRAS